MNELNLSISVVSESDKVLFKRVFYGETVLGFRLTTCIEALHQLYIGVPHKIVVVYDIPDKINNVRL